MIYTCSCMFLFWKGFVSDKFCFPWTADGSGSTVPWGLQLAQILLVPPFPRILQWETIREFANLAEGNKDHRISLTFWHILLCVLRISLQCQTCSTQGLTAAHFAKITMMDFDHPKYREEDLVKKKLRYFRCFTCSNIRVWTLPVIFLGSTRTGETELMKLMMQSWPQFQRNTWSSPQPKISKSLVSNRLMAHCVIILPTYHILISYPLVLARTLLQQYWPW